MPGFPVLHDPLGICSKSCPSSQWCHPTIPSSVAPFSCPQSFPGSGSFPTSQLFTSSGQSIGASASASVLLMYFQGWFPLGLIIRLKNENQMWNSMSNRLASFTSFLKEHHNYHIPVNSTVHPGPQEGPCYPATHNSECGPSGIFLSLLCGYSGWILSSECLWVRHLRFKYTKPPV